MRNYEGLAAMGLIADPKADPDGKLTRRSFLIIDRYLRLLDAAGLPAGQPTATGAMGQGPGGGGPPCCPNEVDEFEVTTDSTEGILAFGRASSFGQLDLTGHALSRIEGFEGNALWTGTNGDSATGAGATIQTAIKRTGDYALRIQQTGAAAAHVSLVPEFNANGVGTTTTFNAMAWRVWMYIGTMPDATRIIATITGGGVDRANLSLGSSGVLTLVGTAGTTVLLADTWYELTIKYDAASTGAISLQIAPEGGDREVEFTNVVPSSNGAVRELRLGKTLATGTYDIYFDDVAIERGTAIANIDYPPPGAVYRVPLTANGGVEDSWGLTGAATRWEACQLPHNADTSYINVSNNGTRQQTFIQECPAATSINGLQIMLRGRSVNSHNTTVLIKGNDVNTTDAGQLDTFITGAIASSSYVDMSVFFQESPYTGVEWTELEVSASILGISVTLAGGATHEFRLTTLAAYVDIGPGTPNDFARAIRVTDDEGYAIPAYLVQEDETIDFLTKNARLVAGTDGSAAHILHTDGSGNLIVVNSSGVTVERGDDTPFTAGTSYVIPMGAFANEGAPDSVNDGDIGAPRMTLDRKLLVRVVGATDANRLQIDGNGEVGLSELPTAAALGDTDANPTTTKVGACIMGLTDDTRGGTPTWTRISSENHTGDDLGDSDDVGLHVSKINKSNTFIPTNVSTTYNNTTTTATSAAVDIRRFNYIVMSFGLVSASTPTDIVIDIETSPDNSNWRKPGDGYHQDLRYDDTACNPQINESIRYDKPDRFVRVVVTATGTDASKTFQISNLKITGFN